jgi:hypothetical protein
VREYTYFPKRSQVSEISLMSRMAGLALLHIAASTGTFAGSLAALSPEARCFASTNPVAMPVGSGAEPSIDEADLSTPSASASPPPTALPLPSSPGPLPAAVATATDPRPATKRRASCSTASPLWVSGAPDRLSLLPRVPALGFCTLPDVALMMERGAGGKRSFLEGGSKIRTTNMIQIIGRRTLNHHPTK